MIYFFLVLIIIILLFFWLYTLAKYRGLTEFTKFLEDENWNQRKELKRALLQLNDCTFYLEKMTGSTDAAGNNARLLFKAKALKQNVTVIESINNLLKCE